MKHTKKLVGLLLALVMVFSLSVPAFAEDTNTNSDTHTITITNEKSGHTYTAYQVFKGDISDGKLINIQWGDGVNGTAVLGALKALTDSPYANCTVAEDVATVLAGFGDDSEELDKFAKIVGEHLSSTSAGTSTETEVSDGGKTSYQYAISVTGDGYYLVKDTGTIGNDDAATKYILEVVKDVTIAAKDEVPELDKKILEADAVGNKGTSVNVGDTVKFQLNSKVPKMDGYDSYTYIVHDTMSSGLTPVDEDKDGLIDVTVTIGGTAYKDFTVSLTSTNGEFTITFDNFISQKGNAGKAIVIEYSAVLNEKALTTNQETNKVNLEYSNNPNDTTTSHTPDKTVYVYDFDIVIDKYTGDKTTGERLSGAKFVLYKKDGDKNLYYSYNETAKQVEWVELADAAAVAAAIKAGTITEVTTDDKGAAKFQGLDTGTYYLCETEAPEGYNLLKKEETVTITAEYNADGTLKSSSAVSTNNGQYSQTTQVENRAGSLLPSTGGRGTTIFYVAGSILLIGAAILLIAKKRMSVEE